MGTKSLTHRISTTLGICVTFILLSCSPLQPDANLAPPRQLKVVPEVIQTMHEIQREFEVETARCLTGFIANGTIYVESMEPTGGILQQDSTSVSFRKCTGNNVVGWFHNHPPSANHQYCSVSPQADVETLTYYRGFWVAIVTCSDSTLVYRFKFDTKDYLNNRYAR